MLLFLFFFFKQIQGLKIVRVDACERYDIPDNADR